MDLAIKGRVALVSGASKGIGKAIAVGLAEAGCELYLVARTKESLEALQQEIFQSTGTQPYIFVGDVSAPDLCDQIFDTLKKRSGKLDILVNNCAGPDMGCFAEHGKENWDRAYESNLFSFINYSTHAAAIMRDNKWGRIINITSYLAKEPTPAMVLSATMRAGVSAFSKSISQELAQDGITVNTICPSAVLTDRMVELTKAAAKRESISYDDVLNRAQDSIPAKRFSTPEEIADLALFLASERSAYITGVSHMIDGGLSKSVF